MMNDQDLDEQLASANPWTDEAVAAFDIAASEHELVATLVAEQPVARHTRRWPIVAAAAAAAAAIITVMAVALPSGHEKSAYAAEVVRVAQANDRLLIDGWSVSRVDEFSVATGEMTFTNDGHDVDVRWLPAEDHDSLVADRVSSSDGRTAAVAVAGREATLLRYANSTRYTAITAAHDGVIIEVVGDLGSETAFRSMLDGVHTSDVNTWLGALPADAVKPADRATVIAAMLQGVPLPAGFDTSSLGSTNVSDHYQLGAKVTGAVTCGWVQEWFVATQNGDTAAAAAAVAAMQTSHQWPILLEMASEGDWSKALWEIADGMKAGHLANGKDGGTLTPDVVTGMLGCSGPAAGPAAPGAATAGS